jgi:hypothetical protein
MTDLVTGRDISAWQGPYDHAAEAARIKFLMLRLFEWRPAGGSFNGVSWPWGIDPQLERNVLLGAQHGKVLGGYHRVDPTRWTAEDEARRMVGVLNLHGLLAPGRMRPAVDIERTGIKAADDAVNWPVWTRQFFAAWRELTNIPLRVYAAGGDFANLLGGVDDWPDPSEVDAWVGHTTQWSTPIKYMPPDQWAGQTPHHLGGRAVLHQFAKPPAADTDLDCFMPGKTWADAVLTAA